MKYCSNCGEKLDDDYDVCLKCGQKYDKPKTQKCKYCGEKIDYYAKVCPFCKKTLNFSIGRVFIGVIIGLFVISLIRVPSVSTNNSSTKDYITLSEFNEIKNGMSYKEVKNIIGSEGTVMSESNTYNTHTIIYYWYGKNGVANANFTFVNDELINKTQIGLN